jgi:peptide/nickel transport system substrate-binding protein
MFRKKWTAVTSLLAVASMLLGACAAPSPTPETQQVTVEVTKIVEGTPETIVEERVITVTPEPTAEPGGIPAVVIDGEPNNLQPFLGTSRVTFTVLDEVNCFLARYDDELEVHPTAAKSWELVDDTTMRFALREGVMFHNGEEMTADDVKFSIEAHLDPDRGSAVRARLASVDEVEVEDDYTAIVHLNRPDAALLDTLIDRVPILPRAVYEEYGSAMTEPVGCGPFRFKEWRENSYIDLEAFPDYFEEGFPKVDGLRFLPLSDYNTAKASFLSKQADVLLWVDPVDVPTLTQMEEVITDIQETFGFNWFGMRVDVAPFDDVRVRQAVKYGVDRPPYLEQVGQGIGFSAYLPIHPDSPYFSPEFEYERDVERAKELLAEAGYPDGLEVELLAPKTPTEEDYGVILQSQLAEIGIAAELVLLDVPSFIERVFTDNDYQIHVCGTTAGPDPAAIMNRYYGSDPLNITHYSDPEVSELLIEASSTFDTQERKELYKEIGLKVLEDSPYVWHTGGARTSAYWNYLDGFVNLPTLRYELWRLEFVKAKD